MGSQSVMVALDSQQYHKLNSSVMRIHRVLWRPYGKEWSIFLSCFISSQRKDNVGKKWQKLIFGCHRENLCQVTFTAEFWAALHFVLFPNVFIPLGFSSVSQRMQTLIMFMSLRKKAYLKFHCY